MQDLNCYIAKFQHIAVVNASERKPDLRISEQNVIGAARCRQRTGLGQMICMKVGIDDVANTHSSCFGGMQIGRDVADGIDDGRSGVPGTSEEVGGGDGIGVQELSQDHGSLLLTAEHRIERS